MIQACFGDIKIAKKYGVIINQVEKDGVLEIPVTGYLSDEALTLGPIKINRFKGRFVKTDIDWCSIDDLIWFLDQSILNENAIMNFFMHSYSLLSFDKQFKKIKKNPKQRFFGTFFGACLR